MMFVNRIGSLILPFITLYTTQDIGWTKVQAGVAVSCYGIGSLAGAYLGGWLTDKIGYYRVIFYSLILAGAAYFVLQYLTGYLVLSGGLFVAALLSDTLRPALYTGLRFFTDDTNQTRAVSLLRMSFNLGLVVGPAIGGVLIAMTSYKWIFIIDAFTCWVAAVMTYKWIKDYSDQQFAKEDTDISIITQSPYRDAPFMLFLLLNLLMLIGFFQILFTVPLYLEEVLGFKTDLIGLFFAFNGMMIFVFEMPLVYFVEKKWAVMPAMIVGAMMMGLAMLSLIINTPLWLPIVCYSILIGYGEIINFPFISTTALRRATNANSGRMMALTSVTFSLALIIAPIVGTRILDTYGYDILWYTMSAFCFVSGIGLIMIRSYFPSEKRILAPDF